MKIKHFAGYGTVTAKKISKTKDPEGKTMLSILVEGDHEQGLVPHFMLPGVNYGIDYTLKNWLIDRFDRDMKDITLRRGITKIDYFSDNAVRYDFVYDPDNNPVW